MYRNYLKVFYIGIFIFGVLVLFYGFFRNQIKGLENQNNPAINMKYKTEGAWKIAEPGMVFVTPSGEYYIKVLDPYQCRYMTKEDAIKEGYRKGLKKNPYVIP
ncbi:hypothetical protein [Lactococcus taiwanensis]|uniref:hypothetical protein n=1 Tax=Lactococcus taiwanensis TaxID=1151742 RepID=UPI00351670B1